MSEQIWLTEAEEISNALSSFIGSARWFTGSAQAPQLEIAESVEIARAEGAAVVIHLMEHNSTTFIVPLVYRPTGSAADQPGAVLATVAGWDIFDATDDELGQRAIISVTLGGREVGTDAFYVSAHATHLQLTDLPRVSQMKKLTSEQSNTSIIYTFAEPTSDGVGGLILKVFRVLNYGKNPDVEIQQALDHAGSRAVPRQYGSLTGHIEDREADLVVAQEFLAGSLDAWQVILDGLANGDTNMDDIRSLGVLTREIHDQLGTIFPTIEASADDRDAMAEQWAQRAQAALRLAPQLEEFAEDIDTLYRVALGVDWPQLQRVHGDYHLGQVLAVPDRGWVALDFEGEPLRPIEQRVRPDLALRDVAGMLRSFDYAAGSVIKSGGNPDAIKNWANRAKTLFLEGYGEIREDERILLDALIVDKALYEVAYEAASRPDWIDIPIAGVQSLLGHA